jgi:hypothetical protein
MQKTRLIAGNSLEPIKPQSKDETPKLDGLKINGIGQSASKARIEQGSETIPSGSRTSVRNGGTDKTNKKNIKEYRIWKGMKGRCYAPCNKNMGTYQKNNITVCERWKNSYDNFLEDMGRIPSTDHTIERMDNLGNYEPSNCKWIHKSEQPKNRGSFNRVFSYNGETRILKDWAKYFGIKYTTLYQRLYRSGWSFGKSIKKSV